MYWGLQITFVLWGLLFIFIAGSQEGKGNNGAAWFFSIVGVILVLIPNFYPIKSDVPLKSVMEINCQEYIKQGEYIVDCDTTYKYYIQR